MDSQSRKRVLIAVDNTDRAAEVIKEGVDLARALGATVFLLRAVGVGSDLPVEAYAMSPDAIADALRERATRELRARAMENGIESDGAILVEIGTAWEAVVKVARERDVDFIVIGAHSYRGLDRMLGTTAARVVNHADRPVLVVRPKPTPA